MVLNGKKKGLAQYAQIKDLILERISNGQLLPGQKLPTERELAQEMGISRTTASAAYQLLEKDGYVESIQGKGTFVCQSVAPKALSKKELMLEAIDRGLERAGELGFSPREFLSFVNVRAAEYEMSMRKVQVLFIDCNEEQAFLFARRLQRDRQVLVNSLLLSDLPARRDSALVKNADLIVTTIRHYDEVRGYVGDREVLALSTTPNLKGLVTLVNTTRTQRVGLVCSGPRFWEVFCRVMENANIPLGNVECYRADTNLAEFVRSHRTVVTTPLMEQRVRDVRDLNDEVFVFPFFFEMDATSARLVKSRIDELKAQKQTL